MEKRLFTWTGWDQHDTCAFSFYDVCLVVAIGNLPVGTKLESAFLDYETGILQFYAEGASVPVQFGIQLLVTEAK